MHKIRSASQSIDLGPAETMPYLIEKASRKTRMDNRDRGLKISSWWSPVARSHTLEANVRSVSQCSG